MNQLHSLTRTAAIVLLLFIYTGSYAQSNYALSFDGTDDYVNTSAYVVPASGNFTVELWVYATTYSGYREFVSQGSSGSAFYIGTTNSTGVIRCGDNWGSTGVTMPLNQWVHIALVKSGASATLYLNGVQKASLASGYSISSAGSSFQIGTQYGGIGEFFNGKIDELRVWNVARTQSEIRAGMLNKNLSNSASGLVAYYRFNEGSGTTAANSCTNTSGINGTLTNGAAWAASPIQFGGNALQFNGSSNYVELMNRINIASSDFTIEAWVYPTSTATGMLFAQDVCGDAEQQFRFYTNNSKVNFDLSDAAALGASYSFQLPSTANSVPLNTWTHIAITRSANNYTLYINGLSNATTSTGANTINNQSGADANKRLRIGARGGVSGGCGLNYFAGRIDEVRFWNVARTGTQVQQNYSAEIDAATNADLVAYYTFNEGIASGTNTGLTTIIDQKGSNDGTLNGFSLTGSTSNFVVQNSSFSVLPLKWLSFTAQKQNESVLLQWSTAYEEGLNNFIIERSDDAKRWKAIGNVLPYNRSEKNDYRFTDALSSTGINYYRIQQNDKDGRHSYSETRAVQVSKQAAMFQVTSNPVRNQALQINIRAATKQTINLFAGDGKLILSKEFFPGIHTIDLGRQVPGIYILSAGEYYEKLLVQ